MKSTKQGSPAVGKEAGEEMSARERLRQARDEELKKLAAEEGVELDFGEGEPAPEAGEPPKEEPPPEPEGEAPPEGEPEPEPEPEGKPKGEEKPPETPPAEPPKVLSREEFESLFKDRKVKLKLDGEEVEVTVGDLVKVNGLEKHYTKRLQEVSERERRLKALEEAPKQRVESGEEKPIYALSDDEVQSQYDELYVESPYRAQQFLSTVQSARMEFRNQKASEALATAYKDFRDTYTDVTDKDMELMGDLNWHGKYSKELNPYRQRGDFFGLFAAARTLLREERLQAKEKDLEAKSASDRQTKSARETAKENAGTIRSNAKAPPPKPTTDEDEEETPEMYMRRRLGR